jgi:hypothetical protein
MTEIVFPCGCSEDMDLRELIPQLYCPMHGLTPPEDEPEPKEQE